MVRMPKIPWNMNCFKCIYPECINDEVLSPQLECYYMKRMKKAAERAKKERKPRARMSEEERKQRKKEQNKLYYQKNRERILERNKENYWKKCKQDGGNNE